MGHRVRYDGISLNNSVFINENRINIEWIPVCPEVECGLPVPREPMHLVGDPGSPSLITAQTSLDYTELMSRWITQKLAVLKIQKPSGFIFKEGSPSCGLRSIPVLQNSGSISRDNSGMFAGEFIKNFKNLPVEEDTNITNTAELEKFLKNCA